MKEVPVHHRQIFRYLRDRFTQPAEVFIYANNHGKCRVPIAHYGTGKRRFYSTVGVCDSRLPLPTGRFEFAAQGAPLWLPNALASSIYWLRDRRVKEWPMVCEDVIKHNVRSTFRHMAYVPSGFCLQTKKVRIVRWLLGVPITDKEIGLGLDEALAKVGRVYPRWLISETEPRSYQGEL